MLSKARHHRRHPTGILMCADQLHQGIALLIGADHDVTHTAPRRVKRNVALIQNRGEMGGDGLHHILIHLTSGHLRVSRTAKGAASKVDLPLVGSKDGIDGAVSITEAVRVGIGRLLQSILALVARKPLECLFNKAVFGDSLRFVGEVHERTSATSPTDRCCMVAYGGHVVSAARNDTPHSSPRMTLMRAFVLDLYFDDIATSDARYGHAAFRPLPHTQTVDSDMIDAHLKDFTSHAQPQLTKRSAQSLWAAGCGNFRATTQPRTCVWPKECAQRTTIAADSRHAHRPCLRKRGRGGLCITHENHKVKSRFARSHARAVSPKPQINSAPSALETADHLPSFNW